MANEYHPKHFHIFLPPNTLYEPQDTAHSITPITSQVTAAGFAETRAQGPSWKIQTEGALKEIQLQAPRLVHPLEN